jgi:SAM-dependent methyltransferase
MSAPAAESPGLDFHLRWTTLQPPLRPHHSVARAIADLLPDPAEPLLLLGVTPELAALPLRMTAVDWNQAMLDRAWPGDSPSKRALLGDWRAMPLADGSMAAAISDGCFTMLDHPGDDLRLLDELARVLVPGGRLIARCFAMPESGETFAEVRRAAEGGTGFHAFKLRLNMAVAWESGKVTIRCGRIFETFTRLFPDRAELSRASGWSLDQIAEIDAYRGRPSILSYPTRSQLLALAAERGLRASFVESSGYALAERCPLLVLDFG